MMPRSKRAKGFPFNINNTFQLAVGKPFTNHSFLHFAGTEAWIDAAGYLRQKDYIADKEGYRILKSKTIYVGQGRGIEVGTAWKAEMELYL